MNEFDPQLEHDLQILKEAIEPSENLVRRISRVTRQTSPRYMLHMNRFKFFIPAAAAIVLVIAIAGFWNDGGTIADPLDGNTGTVSQSSSDEIIHSVVNDALAEQSLVNEADADVALLDSDRAELDSFAASYNANEY